MRLERAKPSLQWLSLSKHCLKSSVKRSSSLDQLFRQDQRLVFLPGTEAEKMAPFLVPVMDAIYKLIPKMVADDLIDQGKIEILSISFARGRNFENAYVIVDEAENLDRKSFYLLMTRVCYGAKLIFCGGLFANRPSKCGRKRSRRCNC